MSDAPLHKFLEDWRDWLKKVNKWSDFEDRACEEILRSIKLFYHPLDRMTKYVANDKEEEWIRIK